MHEYVIVRAAQKHVHSFCENMRNVVLDLFTHENRLKRHTNIWVERERKSESVYLC